MTAIKKIFLLAFLTLIPCACASVQEAAQAVNCKYTLADVNTADFSLGDLTLDIVFAVTNESKTTTAKMNRFEGKFYINDKEMSAISFGEYQIEPMQTQLASATLNLPFNKIGKNIAGLVTMNSISIRYKIAGTIYFDTALGELPFPVSVERDLRKDIK